MNPDEKTDLPLLSTLLFMLIGMIAGFAVSALLSAIALPKFDNLYMSRELFGLMDMSRSDLLQFSMHNVYGVLTVVGIVIAVLVLVWLSWLFRQGRLGGSGKRVFLLVYPLMLVSALSVLALFYSFIGSDVFVIHGSSLPDPTDSALPALLLFGAMVMLLGSINEVDRLSGRTYVGKKRVAIMALAGTAVIILYHLYLATVTRPFFSALFALGGAGETTVQGWHRVYLFMSLFGALIVGTLGAFLTWLARPKSGGMVAVALLAIMTVVAGEGFRYYTDDQLDMRFDTLNDAALLTQLRSVPADRKIILFDGAEQPNVVDWPVRSTTIMGISSPFQTVDLIDENREKLKDYIENGRYTYYTDAALNALVELSKRSWNLSAYRENEFYVIERRANILHALILLASAEQMPVNDENRDFLRKLSDEERFVIRGQSAYRLAKLWIAFGDTTRAEHFYAMVGDIGTSQKVLPFEALLAANRVNSGKIAGVVNGMPPGSKLALITGDSTTDLSRDYAFSSIKAVTSLDGEGTFTFENLLPGQYLLALLLPEGSGKVKGAHGGGALDITPESGIHENVAIELVID
jgi:hypothetical protein